MALSPEEVEEVAEALCVRSHDCTIRPMLVDRLPPKLWGSVPRQRGVIDQYRSDLQTLRDATVNGDEPAVAVYLENAARLLDPLPAAGRCRRLAERIRRGPTWVVLFRPREATHWRQAHPGAECIAADVPSGPWHRSVLPGRDAWVRAFAEVERIAEAVKRDPRPTAVYSSMPYSLGAVFFNGPLAVLQRAAGKLHQPKARIVLHERGVDGMYWPAVAFEGGRARLLAPESQT